MSLFVDGFSYRYNDCCCWGFLRQIYKNHLPNKKLIPETIIVETCKMSFPFFFFFFPFSFLNLKYPYYDKQVVVVFVILDEAVNI